MFNKECGKFYFIGFTRSPVKDELFCHSHRLLAEAVVFEHPTAATHFSRILLFRGLLSPVFEKDNALEQNLEKGYVSYHCKSSLPANF